jgi:predicted house-cleaning noncanonical NTP pyrophosphatase (MazG superfamily)
MNNFDQSSSGYNIELNAFYDNDASIRIFDDMFTCVSRDSFSLLNGRYRGVNIYAYDMPASFELFDLDNWIMPTKKVLHDLILDNLFNGCKGSMNTETKDQFSKLSYQLTKCQLIEFLKDTYQEDLNSFIVEHLTPKFTVVSSRGYSQGDYAEVIYFKEDYNNNDSLDFDNELWASPIYIRLTVNDEEFYIEEFLKNPYNYDQDELEQVITKLINESGFNDKESIINQVIAMLPSELEYQY